MSSYMFDKEKIEKRAARFAEHLPPSGDDTLVILKGHLLIEEVLTETLLAKLSQSNPLGIKISSNTTFSQKLNLCWALIQDEIIVVEAWNHLKELNLIRNKLAHSLEPKGIEDKISKFIKGITSSKFYLGEPRKGYELQECISWLYAMHSQLMDHVKNS